MALSKIDIQNAILNQHATWNVDQTSNPNMSQDDMKHKLGWQPGSDPAYIAAREKLSTTNAFILAQQLAIPAILPPVAPPIAFTATSLPPQYDLRNIGGVNYVTSVKDQGLCGACVAFGAVATVECQLQLGPNNGQPERDLSEAHLFFCIGSATGASCDSGWDIPDALDGFRDTGVHDEPCFPYTGQGPCLINCPPNSNPPTLISDWRPHTRIKDMKSWLVNNGPLVTGMSIYEDFFQYGTGIYRHVAGAYLGGHCVCCVGYEENKVANEKYWICKNSWGVGWGEQGYFKIAYGECGIDAVMWGVKL